MECLTKCLDVRYCTQRGRCGNIALTETVAEARASMTAERNRRRIKGYGYWNPDTGWEWTPDHPVESGETPDAERVEAMTLTQFEALHPAPGAALAAPPPQAP